MAMKTRRAKAIKTAHLDPAGPRTQAAAIFSSRNINVNVNLIKKNNNNMWNKTKPVAIFGEWKSP